MTATSALYTKIVYLSTTPPPKATLSKVEIQTLATSNDPSISFAKPANVRSEVWTNYSQVYYKTEGLDYIICLQCRVVLKWISENGIHYGGLSLHYIDAQLNLRVFTLACRAYDYTTQHSINIRLFVDKILEEFNLPLNDHVFIVTDNENKMKSAFKDDVKRIGCSAHYINKVLEHASKNDSINCDAVCQ
ncbi:unnamed protein product [Rotaria magnacalcarata]|uniref:Uncharacterized protein n=1 Tax=Rotaria magnacalcarata TaxID=392030 RepID=A0A814MXS2_9BILA|nr:unnamed protein product [Rotaria magnacalcarata]CAF5055014.1 unnamed protein product [Rotaria magnacalcarata]